MRKIKSILLACTLICSATASAQFTTGGKSGSTSTSTGEISSYNQIGISYVYESFKYDFPKGGPTEDMDMGTNGFGIKYIHGFNVSDKLPMFVETGANFNFNFGSNEGEMGTQKFQWASLAVPINFAYKFNINENFAIKPYLGINLKFNLLGRNKMEYGDGEDWDEDWDDDDYDWRSYGYGDWDDDDYDDDEYGDSKWQNVFSKKDMGKDVWNRFQLGWHIGADVQFKKYFVGISYGTDFIKAFKQKNYSVNTGTLNVTLGFCF